MQKTQFSHQEHDLRALIAQTAERFHATTVICGTADGFLYQLIYSNADSWPYRCTLWLEYSRTEEQLRLQMLPSCAKPVETVDEKRQAQLFAGEALANTPISLCIKSNEIRLLQTVPYPEVLLTTVEQMEHLIGQFGRYARDVVQAIDDRTFCLLKPKNPKPAAPVLRYTPEQQRVIDMLRDYLSEDVVEYEERVYDPTMRAFFFIEHLRDFTLYCTIRPLFGSQTYLTIEVRTETKQLHAGPVSDPTVDEAIRRFNRQGGFEAKICGSAGQLRFTKNLTAAEVTRDRIGSLIRGLISSTEALDVCALLKNRNKKTISYTVTPSTK